MILRKLREILGVDEAYAKAVRPQKSLAAVPSPSKAVGVDEPPGAVARRRRDPDPATAEYLPERLLPLHGAEAVAPDGSVWMRWREESSTREQWYRRVSYLPGTMRGIEAYRHDPLSADDSFDSLDEFDDETGEKIYDPYLILRNARNRIAARQLAGRNLILDDIGGDDDDIDE